MRYLILILAVCMSQVASANPPTRVIRAQPSRMINEMVEAPGPSDAPRRTIVEDEPTTVEIPGRRTIIDQLPDRRITKQATVIEELPPQVIRRQASPVFVDTFFVDTWFVSSPVWAQQRRMAPRRSFSRTRTVERGIW